MTGCSCVGSIRRTNDYVKNFPRSWSECDDLRLLVRRYFVNWMALRIQFRHAASQSLKADPFET